MQREVVQQSAGEHGAECRDAERAPDAAEERGSRGGHAEPRVGHRVLHRHDKHLHHETDAEPDDEHVGRGHRQRRVRAETREQQETGGEHERPDDRERSCSGPCA